jgi:hypothetical protein
VAVLQATKTPDDYLGEVGFLEYEKQQGQFQRLQYKYWIAKRALIDMVNLFAELSSKHGVDYDLAQQRLLLMAGISQSDFEDSEIQQMIGVFDEVSKGLCGSEDLNSDEDISE